MLNLIQLLLFSLVFISMSLYYQVMGSLKCPNPKPKKHTGIKIVPAHKSKEPYNPGEVVIFTCESTETKQSIKCLDTGKWNELPTCPDYANSTCPDLGPIQNGSYNSTGPLKVGSIVVFECNPTNQTDQIRYQLNGPKYLKCLPSAKWNQQAPICSPILPEPTSDLGLIFISALLIIVPIILFVIIAQLVIRWRKKQQQRERWKQYFTDYKYRHSKTSITFNTRPQNPDTTIPVTDL